MGFGETGELSTNRRRRAKQRRQDRKKKIGKGKKKVEKRGLDDDAKLVCDSGMVSGNLRQVGVQVAAKSNQRRGAIKGTKKASLSFSPQLGQEARSGGVFFSRLKAGGRSCT